MAQAAHGLTMDDLQGAQYWPGVAHDLIVWLHRECQRTHPHGCVPVFIGHNINKCGPLAGGKRRVGPSQ